MEEFIVYVLYSNQYNKFYIGFTSDLLNRMRSHNFHGKGDYTSKYRPWEVIYIEFFDSKKEAMLREKQLKSARGRDFVKEKLLVK